MTLTFGSLFAGIGGFDEGLERAGMKCTWQVEIDEKCQAVLHRHWPDVPKHGDIRDVGRHNLESVDVICGGSPCQDLSVAGQRAGLAGERSGLWFEFLRVVAELEPGWVIFENVPGLLSSWSAVEPPPYEIPARAFNTREEAERWADSLRGEWFVDEASDFEAVLSGLAELGYGITWKICDAQYFGVPQRRRRVFIVAGFGTNQGRVAQILFERESSAWDPPPSREARTDVAAPITKSFAKHHGASAGKDSYPHNLVYNTFNGYTGGADDNDAQSGHLVRAVRPVDQGHGSLGRDMEGVGMDVPVSRTGIPPNTGRLDTGVQDDVAAPLAAHHCPRHNGGEETLVPVLSNALTACKTSTGRLDPNEQTFIPIGFDRTRGTSSGQIAAPLRACGAATEGVNDAKADTQCVAYGVSENQRAEVRLTPYSRQITSGGGKPGQGYPCVFQPRYARNGRGAPDAIAAPLTAEGKGWRNDGVSWTLDGRSDADAVAGSWGVRRLTPTECERLQGFPDGWTARQSDSARYRQLGNAVCVPVIEWIGKRITEATDA